MPIYEYKCNNCGSRFDQIRRMDCIDQPLTCPNCGTRDYHEVMVSNCHFNFVGGMPSYGGSGYNEVEDE